MYRTTIFYSFTNIILTLLHIFGEHPSVSPILLLDLHLSIFDGFTSCKYCEKRDDFDFEIVNFPYLDGDVPRRASYGVYRYRNLFGSLECLVMLLTSTVEINH